jgi:hypothetical protein
MEVEFEVASLAFVLFAVAARDYFHFIERIDRADQVFLGALAPQNFDELAGDGQRLRRHQVAQQVFESDAGDGFALEQRAGRVGVNLTNLEIGVEQEQTFAHGAQDVFGLLAGGRRGRGLFAARQ